MINSLFPIADRVYFLKKGNRYCEYRYTEQGNSFSGKFIKKTVSLQTNNKIAQKLLASMTLPFEQDIWNHAPKAIQNALLFSFLYHQTYPKVANVEIDNWLTIPYFAELFERGKKRMSLFMVHGNHKKNLRIGHILFTYDILYGKEVYCIHWDIGASRFSPSIFIHWLFDDMSS